MHNKSLSWLPGQSAAKSRQYNWQCNALFRATPEQQRLKNVLNCQLHHPQVHQVCQHLWKLQRHIDDKWHALTNPCMTNALGHLCPEAYDVIYHCLRQRFVPLSWEASFWLKCGYSRLDIFKKCCDCGLGSTLSGQRTWLTFRLKL